MATQVLERTLRKANGLPRKGVMVCVREQDTGVLRAKDSTDDRGYVRFDTSTWESGIYKIEYYGDGIIRTRFDPTDNVIEEDPVTPWEYNIQILNQSVEADHTPPIDSVAVEAELSS